MQAAEKILHVIYYLVTWHLSEIFFVNNLRNGSSLFRRFAESMLFRREFVNKESFFRSPIFHHISLDTAF